MKKITIVMVMSLLVSFCGLFRVNANEDMALSADTLADSVQLSFNEELSDSDNNLLENTITENYVKNIDGNQVTLISQTSLNFVANNSNIVNEYVCETDFVYDAVTVTYFSTDGVVLHTNSYKETNPTENSVAVSFTPQNPFIDDEKKNVYDYQEDKVLASVSFWKGEEICHTESVDLSILYTPHGTFMSDIDPIFCKRNYCRYLLSNDLIDDATYEDLNVMFHRYGKNASEQLYVTMSEFDKTVSADEKSKLLSVFSNGNDILYASDAAGAAMTTEKKIYAEVTCAVQLCVDDQLQVVGDVYWYDEEGKQFPAQYVKIEIMDEDILSHDLVATVITDGNGHFNAVFDNQPLENGRDIYLKVYCGNEDTMVYDFGMCDFLTSAPIDSFLPEPYFFATDVATDILSSREQLEGNSGAGTAIAKAFSIGNALYYGREYEKYINGGEPLDGLVTKIYYPLPIITTSFTLPIFSIGCILLTENNYSRWGTILHEYGHSVEDKLNIFVGYEALRSEGWFTHDSRFNLTDLYKGDKAKALNISWNEGWASYYSNCVQRKYSLQSEGYPGASDTDVLGHDIVDWYYFGEDHELAIATAITNIVTQNLLTEEEMWDLVKYNRPEGFHDLYELVLHEIMANQTPAGFPSAKLRKYLAILEKQNISAKTNINNAHFEFSSYGPTITWTKPQMDTDNQNGHVFLFEYRVLIVSGDPEYEYISPVITDTEFTIPAAEWKAILDNCPNGFYWTVSTMEVNTPVSGAYFSKLNRMLYDTEDMTIQSNSRYKEAREYISAGDCYDYRVTFKTGGNKLVQTFGTKDTVLELYSSNGTLLLGQSNTDDKGYSWNALFSYNFSADTEYIIRVRHYSTSDSGTVRFAIVPTYSHSSYESAYGTYGTTTVSWSLSKDRVALFRYKFVSTGDIAFTMSSENDTYLYVIDPTSTELMTKYDGSNFDAANLYDDDSGEGWQAQLIKTVEANKEYLVIISFFNPHTMSGGFSINTRYVT